MRLADFLLANREPVLAEWEAFARSCAPASDSMDIDALRDHADEMLLAIAADLRTPQTAEEQAEKSLGRAPVDPAAPQTAAEVHGAGRALSGFSIQQMVAEYRALRASVLRLWTASKGELGTADIDDLIRFDEAIDQAVAESVVRYSREVELAQEMFLAILGHDLRTPLGAISTSAQYMAGMSDTGEPQRRLSHGIVQSASNTLKLVGDLLDFTRTRLGGGIPIRLQDTDLGTLVEEVAREVGAAHPRTTIAVDARGDLHGRWDPERLRQALTNLVENAVRHGARSAPVTVIASGHDDAAAVAIHNAGAAIPPDALHALFDPMKPGGRAGASRSAAPTASLGLGLYIAQRIALAHSGRIDVRSSDAAGTTFTLTLPRTRAAG